ncbi:2-C-methyl-D-erythritol 4-phosphate cytidylyltransferase [Seinonella peptonophila]|uniref:2-C-methyl-D-erythritol 4-phosphate cytidylyltransferase n=1 Tax=Seinonella peptonophila TaxID=112248 RepID=A0A1M4YU43_9BACL|nr:2-C-methyl-D-erythritol 4-phosphate cytidylyltransferase [Seinonella peptonophila]
MSVGVVIPAAGVGKRMGTKESKQFLFLHHSPILVHTLEIFDSHPQVDEIVVVTRADEIERCYEWLDREHLSKVKKVVPGGRERQESVFLGLQQLTTDYVLVHDAVRPFVTSDLVGRIIDLVRVEQAVVTAVPMKDTVKRSDDSRYVSQTIERQSLWAIQTPQAFQRDLLWKAHQRADGKLFATDDSMLVEELGFPVKIIEGEYTNIKITTPDDLLFAEAIFQMRGLKKDDSIRTRV